MKLIPFPIDAPHLIIAHLASDRVFPTIQSTCDFQSLGCGRPGDEMDDGFIIPQGFSTSVGRDKGKESVFGLVPFVCAGRKMTDGNAESGLVSPFLQLPLPESQPRSIAPAAVGCNKNVFRIRINSPSFSASPPPNGGHGKFSGVMIGSHADKTGITSEVVNTIGVTREISGSGKS